VRWALERPLWRFFPPHFAGPGLCFAKPLFGLAKRRIPFRVMRNTTCLIFENIKNKGTSRTYIQEKILYKKSLF
jgi:hypothetical protein